MIVLSGLPFPPTSNHRLMFTRGRLITAPEHRKYKALLDLYLHRHYLKVDASQGQGKQLKVVVKYIGPIESWFTKKGEIRKLDVENRSKQLLDRVFHFIDLDDSQIFELVVSKVIGGSEVTVEVEITWA